MAGADVIDDLIQQVDAGRPVDLQRAALLQSLHEAQAARRFVEQQHAAEVAADNALALAFGVNPESIPSMRLTNEVD